MWMLAFGQTQSYRQGGDSIFYTPSPKLSTAPRNLALNFEALATRHLPSCQPHTHSTNPLQRGPGDFCPPTPLSLSEMPNLILSIL